MITGTLRSKVDKLWDEFWTGGISNPLTVIEQITFLMFTRLLDIRETTAEKQWTRPTPASLIKASTVQASRNSAGKIFPSAVARKCSRLSG